MQKHEDLLVELQDRLLEEANFVIYPTVMEDYFEQVLTPVPPES